MESRINLYREKLTRFLQEAMRMSTFFSDGCHFFSDSYISLRQVTADLPIPFAVFLLLLNCLLAGKAAWPSVIVKFIDGLELRKKNIGLTQFQKMFNHIKMVANRSVM